MRWNYDLAGRISESERSIRVLNALDLLKGDIAQTIVLAGSPRSGTTWLAELLATLPEYTLVDEPLHQRWAAAREAGFNDWRTYIAPSECRPAARAYMKKALSGCVASNRQFGGANQFSKIYELFTGEKNVGKFVRANRLLHWVHRQFPLRGMILMLRHPCAVVASQLDYEDDVWRRTQPPGQDNLQSGFCGWIPDDVLRRFESVLAGVRSTAGRLAAVWCLDTYFPLYEKASFPGFVTTYERLLTHKANEVKRIFQYLGAPVPEEAHQSFDEASYSASADLITEDVQRQLSKWKDKLSPAQIDDVLSVVEGFGLDFYTNALEPDYEQIEHLQREIEEFSV